MEGLTEHPMSESDTIRDLCEKRMSEPVELWDALEAKGIRVAPFLGRNLDFGAPPACYLPRSPVAEAELGETIKRYGLTKTESEELLDWLEALGHRFCGLSYVAENGFTVRYRLVNFTSPLSLVPP